MFFYVVKVTLIKLSDYRPMVFTFGMVLVSEFYGN